MRLIKKCATHIYWIHFVTFLSETTQTNCSTLPPSHRGGGGGTEQTLVVATREILAAHVPKGVNPVAGGCLFPLDSIRLSFAYAARNYNACGKWELRIGNKYFE